MQVLQHKIWQKLQNKNSIPVDKNHQLSFFSQLLQDFQEITELLGQNEEPVNQTEMESYLKNIQCIIQFPFKEYPNLDIFANFIVLFLRRLMQNDYQFSEKVIQILSAQLSNAKSKNQQKNSLTILAQLMKYRAKVKGFSYMIYQEILNQIVKSMKLFNELSMKLFIARILQYLCKEKLITNNVNLNDIFKILMKLLQDKDSELLKSISAQAFFIFLQNCDPQFVVSNFLSIYPIIQRNLQEAQIQSHIKKLVQIISTLIDTYYTCNDLRNQEIKEDFKQKKAAVKKKQVFENNVSLNVNTVYYQINEHIFQQIQCHELPHMKMHYIEVLLLITLKNCDELQEKQIKELLKMIQTHFLSYESETLIYKIREAFCPFFYQLAMAMSKAQKSIFYVQLTQNLEALHKQFIDQKMRLQQLTHQFQQTRLPMQLSKQQMQHMEQSLERIEQLIIILLRSVMVLVKGLGPSLFDICPQPKNFFDQMRPFFSYAHKIVSLTTSQIIRAFVQKNPKWKQHILSLLMNELTVLMAEMEGVKDIFQIQAAENAAAAAQYDSSDQALQDMAISLYGHSICISLVLKDKQSEQLHSETRTLTFDITNSIFETIKRLIRGRGRASNKSHQLQQQNQNPSSNAQQQYVVQRKIQLVNKQCGWLLLADTLNLDVAWTGLKLQEIFQLWKEYYEQEASLSQNVRIAELELRCQTACLQSLNSFLKFANDNHMQLQGVGEVHTLISGFLLNFHSQFFSTTATPTPTTTTNNNTTNNSNNNQNESVTKNTKKINLSTSSASDVIRAKNEMYTCLACIAPDHYSQKLNVLVQMAIQDIFITNQCNLYFKMGTLIGKEAAQFAKMAQKSSNISVVQEEKGVLFSENDLLKQNNTIKQFEQILLTYDRPYLKFKESLHAVKQDLAISIITFLSKLFVSTHFSMKNKKALIVYLDSNLTNYVFSITQQSQLLNQTAAAAPQQNTNSEIKIFPYLLLTIKIAESLLSVEQSACRQNQSQSINQSSSQIVTCDKEMVDRMLHISQCCWGVKNGHVVMLVSKLFGLVQQLAAMQEQAAQRTIKPILQEMSQMLNNNNSQIQYQDSTIAAVLAELTQVFPFEVIFNDKQQFSLYCNIVQKICQRNSEHQPIWTLSAILVSLQRFGTNSEDLFVSSVQFLIKSCISKNALDPYNHWYNQRIFNVLLKNITANSSERVLNLASRTFFSCVQQVQLYYKPFFILNSKLLALQNKHLFQQQTPSLAKMELQSNQSKPYIQKVLKIFSQMNITSQSKQLVNEILQIIQNLSLSDIKQYNLDIQVQEAILQKYNQLTSQVDAFPDIQTLLISLYTEGLKGELKISVMPYNEKFNYFKSILYMDSFKSVKQNNDPDQITSPDIQNNNDQNQTYNNDNDNKYQDDDKRREKSQIQNVKKKRSVYAFNENTQNMKLDITLETRQLMLRCAEIIITQCDLSCIDSSQITQFANLIITFLFKVITSIFEELREQGLRLFLTVFTKLYKYNDNGVRFDPKHYDVYNETPMLQQFSAQIDPIISVNLKNETINYPEINVITFCLFYKFSKMLLKSDVQIIAKLFGLMTKPLFNNLKLNVSTYYDEKSSSMLIFKRLEIIAKFYLLIYNTKDDKVNQTFFNPTLRIFFIQNLSVSIHDIIVLKTNSRQELAHYTKFFFVYNASQASNDIAQLDDNVIMILIKAYLLTNIEQQQIIGKNSSDQETSSQYNTLIMQNQKIMPKKVPGLIFSFILQQMSCEKPLDKKSVDQILFSHIQRNIDYLLVIKQVLILHLLQLQQFYEQFCNDELEISGYLQISFVLFQLNIPELQETILQSYMLILQIFEAIFKGVSSLPNRQNEVQAHYNNLLKQMSVHISQKLTLTAYKSQLNFNAVFKLFCQVLQIIFKNQNQNETQEVDIDNNNDMKELLFNFAFFVSKFYSCLQQIDQQRRVSQDVFNVLQIAGLQNEQVAKYFLTTLLQMQRYMIVHNQQQFDRTEQQIVFSFEILAQLSTIKPNDSLGASDIIEEIHNEIYRTLLQNIDLLEKTLSYLQKASMNLDLKSAPLVIDLILMCITKFTTEHDFTHIAAMQDMLKIVFTIFVVLQQRQASLLEESFCPLMVTIMQFVDKQFPLEVLQMANQVLKHILTSFQHERMLQLIEEEELFQLPQHEQIKQRILKIIVNAKNQVQVEQPQQLDQSQIQSQVQNQQQIKAENVGTSTIKLKAFGFKKK